jgi:hypothetical protein
MTGGLNNGGLNWHRSSRTVFDKKMTGGDLDQQKSVVDWMCGELFQELLGISEAAS